MRRTFVTIATIALLTLAGCAGSPAPATTDTAPPIDLSASNSTATQPDQSAKVAYNADTTETLPTDPPTQAEDGYRWVVVNMRVTNTGETAREVTAHQYVLRGEDDVYGYVQVDEPWALGYGPDAGIAPGESRTGWVVFHVPTDVSDAELTTRTDTSRSYAVGFIPDPSLPLQPPT